jgi:hypothetical protein
VSVGLNGNSALVSTKETLLYLSGLRILAKAMNQSSNQGGLRVCFHSGQVLGTATKAGRGL